jgi:hypothetical protein
VIGLIADLVRLNRKMLEETLHGVRRMELDAGTKPLMRKSSAKPLKSDDFCVIIILFSK